MSAQVQPGNPNFRFLCDPGPVWHSIWPPGRIERNRRIYDYELVYFANGGGRVITAGGVYECARGSAIIIPPKLVHCTVARTQLERWCVHFDWFGDCRAHREAPRIFVYEDEAGPFREELCAGAPELPGVVFPLFRREVPREILPLLQRYFLPHPEDSAGELTRRGLLMQILGMILGEGEGEPPRGRESGELLFRARNFIDANCLRGTLSVAETAAECGVSAGHLTRLFHRSFGMPVSDYIQFKRLLRSRKLLQESTLTIREIAYESGFDDANYFSRFFRRKTGMTPVEFRRAAGHPAESMEE